MSIFITNHKGVCGWMRRVCNGAIKDRPRKGSPPGPAARFKPERGIPCLAAREHHGTLGTKVGRCPCSRDLLATLLASLHGQTCPQLVEADIGRKVADSRFDPKPTR